MACSILVFTLSMPNNNSWNGRWSGSERAYNIVKNMGTSKKAAAKAEALVEAGDFSYSFSDGWRASVNVKLVDATGARKARKISDGFCGYDWMVSSILYHGDIRT